MSSTTTRLPDTPNDDAVGGRPARMSSLLLVDSAPEELGELRQNLQAQFDLVEVAPTTAMADELLVRCHFDVIVTEARLADRSGIEWVAALREQDNTTPVVFMAAGPDLHTAIAALRAGSSDFILKPFHGDEMRAALHRVIERQRMQRENYLLRRQVEQLYDSTGMVGSCDAIRDLCEVIRRVAPMPSTVLIEGESGTGKELAARAIHRWSGRSGSFVPVNCGSMSAELLESELFGHVKGAFTGANQPREGLFAYADGGTLFLDEIGEMPMGMQTHLLRVMEEKAVRPVGGNRQLPVDVRIIAATNRDLSAEVEQGNFREDLYYRLNVLSIRMPALRERLSDLPELVRHFVVTLARELGVEPPPVSDAEVQRLAGYDWPGNVRELKNVIERCLLLNTPPSQCVANLGAAAPPPPATDGGDDLSLEAVERRHILKVLELEGGNKSAAARRLGVSRKTLERRCHAWGV